MFHSSFFSITQNAFDIADPCRTQDAYRMHARYKEFSKYVLARTSLPVAQWLERPTGILKIMRSFLVRNSEFSLLSC